MNRLLASLALVASLFAFASPAGAATVFALQKGSAFEQGCFAPCECPVLFQDDLQGRLIMIPSGSVNGYDVFKVIDVKWMLLYLGAETWVQGTGTYRANPSLKLQQLELDLILGDGGVQHYDSGLVPIRVDPPAIEITISKNKQYCYDTVFSIDASPAANDLHPPRLQFEQNDRATDAVITWGRLKKLWTP
jgi:hypothetical protein